MWIPAEWLKVIGHSETVGVRLDPHAKTITVSVPDDDELRAHEEGKEMEWFLEKEKSFGQEKGWRREASQEEE